MCFPVYDNYINMLIQLNIHMLNMLILQITDLIIITYLFLKITSDNYNVLISKDKRSDNYNILISKDNRSDNYNVLISKDNI